MGKFIEENPVDQGHDCQVLVNLPCVTLVDGGNVTWQLPLNASVEGYYNASASLAPINKLEEARRELEEERRQVAVLKQRVAELEESVKQYARAQAVLDRARKTYGQLLAEWKRTKDEACAVKACSIAFVPLPQHESDSPSLLASCVHAAAKDGGTMCGRDESGSSKAIDRNEVTCPSCLAAMKPAPVPTQHKPQHCTTCNQALPRHAGWCPHRG